jgi:hypothetical protein
MEGKGKEDTYATGQGRVKKASFCSLGVSRERETEVVFSPLRDFNLCGRVRERKRIVWLQREEEFGGVRKHSRNNRDRGSGAMSQNLDRSASGSVAVG